MSFLNNIETILDTIYRDHAIFMKHILVIGTNSKIYDLIAFYTQGL